ALAHLVCGYLTQPSRIPRMPTIELLGPLVPGEDHLVSINDNNTVTGIDMRSVAGFMLPTQNLRNFSGQAPHDLVLGIDNIPLANHIFFPNGNRMHAVHSCPSPTPDSGKHKDRGQLLLCQGPTPALSCRILYLTLIEKM